MNLSKGNLLKFIFIAALIFSQVSFGSTAYAISHEEPIELEQNGEEESTHEEPIELEQNREEESTHEEIIELEVNGEDGSIEEESIEGPIVYTPIVTETPGRVKRAPNVIPVTLTPSHTGLAVYVGNIGVDPLDSVTVKVTATGYSEQTETKTKISQLGATFNFDISMIYTTMNYKVTVVITDGGQVRTIGKDTKLEFTEDQLSEWDKGTYKSRKQSVDEHFGKHAREVGAKTIQDYLNKASQMHADVRGIKATNNTYNVVTAPASGKYAAYRKYTIKGTSRYIMVTQTKQTKILTFGGKL